MGALTQAATAEAQANRTFERRIEHRMDELESRIAELERLQARDRERLERLEKLYCTERQLENVLGRIKLCRNDAQGVELRRQLASLLRQHTGLLVALGWGTGSRQWQKMTTH